MSTVGRGGAIERSEDWVQIGLEGEMVGYKRERNVREAQIAKARVGRFWERRRWCSDSPDPGPKQISRR